MTRLSSPSCQHYSLNDRYAWLILSEYIWLSCHATPFPPWRDNASRDVLNQQQLRWDQVYLINDSSVTFSGSSFKCYQCIPETDGVKEYTTEQCLKDQTIVDCMYACARIHRVSDDDKEYETRACYVKSACEERKKTCEDKAQLKASGLKECSVTCCVSDSDTPCNGGLSVFIDSISMMMTVMLAVLCTLKLF